MFHLRPKRILPVTAVLLPGLLLFIATPFASTAQVSVAVVPFYSASSKETPLERTATAFLSKRLQAVPDVRLVPADRTSAVAAELGITADAPVGDARARHLGTLAEADIVIVGSTEASGTRLALSARCVGVKSLRSDEVLLEGSRIGQITPLVSSFTDRVTALLAERKHALAFSSPADLIVAEQRAVLAGMTLPSVFLSVTEEYEGRRRPESAGGVLLAEMLRALGFELTPAVKGADIILVAVAKGHSEGRFRSAVISRSDLEIRAVDTLHGRVIYHESLSHSAVDALASAAGSRAFREGVLLVAGTLLPSMASATPTDAVSLP